jgi:hypothetical protein
MIDQRRPGLMATAGRCGVGEIFAVACVGAPLKYVLARSMDRRTAGTAGHLPVPDSGNQQCRSARRRCSALWRCSSGYVKPTTRPHCRLRSSRWRRGVSNDFEQRRPVTSRFWKSAPPGFDVRQRTMKTPVAVLEERIDAVLAEVRVYRDCIGSIADETPRMAYRSGRRADVARLASSNTIIAGIAAFDIRTQPRVAPRPFAAVQQANCGL